MSNQKEKMKTSDVVLIVIGIIIIAIIIVEHIFYWFKGGYPVELVLALVPPCITELWVIAKLTINKREYENKGVVDSVDETTK